MTEAHIQPAIEIAQLHHRYGTDPVLRGLDLTLQPGEIYALMGGNGAGKSTTLAALLGFISPESGTVRVCGIDPVADPRAARAQMAMTVTRKVPTMVSVVKSLLTASVTKEPLTSSPGVRPKLSKLTVQAAPQ